jgi:hypothetical protein
MTAEQVNSAIERLGASFSYDPPNRWMDAYRELRELARDMEAQLRPYRWIAWSCSALGFGWLIFTLILFMGRPLLIFSITSNVLVDAFLFITAMSLSGPIIAGGHSLVIHLAARRYPLLRLKSKIEAAIRHGDRLAQPYFPKAPE